MDRLIALFVCIIAVPTMAQVTFKNNHLGMTLDEFKQINKGEPVWVNTGDPTKRLNKKLSRQVETPFCTDTLDGFEGSDVGRRAPEEVICNISPGTFNVTAKKIGVMLMRSVVYRFYRGELYRIDLSFPPYYFAGMRLAFRDKFGPESYSSKTDCQNAFGARWTGDSPHWRVSPTVTASLWEGCHNGPGQNSSDSESIGDISDDSYRPPPTAIVKPVPVF